MDNRNSKVIVCIGSGGVGKTTISAALGAYLADKGKKVLVLTIDPSKRLAQTLGIEGKAEVTKVPNQNFSGELFASIIDHQKVFDEFITRASSKQESTAKILNSKLYQQLSTNLSGSQDFTALEKLYSSYESQNYDYIILDTPPAKHAIDFLKAPQKLSALFNENITKWFRDTEHGGSWLSSLVSVGTKQVLKILESLTGSEFLKELSYFFSQIQEWQGELEKRNHNFHKLLTDLNTEFYLVTSFDEAKLKEAELISKEIRKQGYNLTRVILNRAFPEWLSGVNSEESFFQVIDNNQRLSSEIKSNLKQVYSQFLINQQRKDQFYKKFESNISKNIKTMRIKESSATVSNIQDLEMIFKMFQNELFESL